MKDSYPSLFTCELRTTTKPRPARRARKSKTSAPTQGRTQSVKPNPKLISWDEYKRDFFNRIDIHNYEISEVRKDIANCVAFTASTYKEYREKFDTLLIGEDVES